MSANAALAEQAANPRRRTPRQRVLLSGRLVMGDALAVLDCAIRNLSNFGARVQLADGHTAPDLVHLIEVRNGCVYKAEVVWRDYPHIGLAFLDRRDLKEERDAPDLAPFRALWAGAQVR
jgi:PilZ domain